MRGPEPRPALCASLRSRNACQDFTRATLFGHLQEKCRGPEPRPILCASLCSRNACQDFTRATLYGNSQVKCCRPEPRPALCASLRSRNACQDFTRATLFGHLQEKCRGPEWAPWSSTGLYTYRKNPSVWTHCLRKRIRIKRENQEWWFNGILTWNDGDMGYLIFLTNHSISILDASEWGTPTGQFKSENDDQPSVLCVDPFADKSEQLDTTPMWDMELTSGLGLNHVRFANKIW